MPKSGKRVAATSWSSATGKPTQSRGDTSEATPRSVGLEKSIPAAATPSFAIPTGAVDGSLPPGGPQSAAAVLPVTSGLACLCVAQPRQNAGTCLMDKNLSFSCICPNGCIRNSPKKVSFTVCHGLHGRVIALSLPGQLLERTDHQLHVHGYEYYIIFSSWEMGWFQMYAQLSRMLSRHHLCLLFLVALNTCHP